MSIQIILSFIIFLFFIFLIGKCGISLVQQIRNPVQKENGSKQVFVLNKYSPVLTFFSNLPDRAGVWFHRILLSSAIEIIIIICWGLFIGRNFLDLNPLVWPTGMEFGSAIQMNHIWSNLIKCGSCVFWNGDVRGGAPAFADLYGSALHPVVFVSTLLLGLANGAKVTIIISFILSGLAQWWLARIMGVGRLARIWVSLLGVCGGFITTRIELGTVGIVLSTASCSLVIPPALGLVFTGQRRYAILSGVFLGLALLSGQGYLQVGLALCILPPLAIFLFLKAPYRKELQKNFLLVLVLAILIAGVFLVPMAHYYPFVSKFVDPEFSSSQPLRYIPLNLVIDQSEFYSSQILEKYPFPYMTGNYIGWIPVLLAFLSVRFFSRKNLPVLLFFATSIFLVFVTASSVSLKLIGIFFPAAYGIRHAGIIAGLAGPLVLGLAAYGLDRILKSDYPKLNIDWGFDYRGQPSFHIAKLNILTLPFLIFNVFSVVRYSDNWLKTYYVKDEIYDKMSFLQTGSSEWVNPPFGEEFWLIPALEANLKIADAIRPWEWKERPNPKALVEMVYRNPDPSDPHYVLTDDTITVMSYPENEYAIRVSEDGITKCYGYSSGGQIEVVCPRGSVGTLIVRENTWTGWHVWVDGTPGQLLHGQWLSVKLSAGEHKIVFRYQPWDVWVGIILVIFGILWSIWLWRHSPPLMHTILTDIHPPHTSG